MKYYLIAGEASGDLHGANLIKSLKELDSQPEFRFFGGDLMAAEAGEPVKHYADMAFMGFVEVLLNLRIVLKNIAFCKQDVLAWKPDVLILIDFPGFNLKIADFAKKHGIKVFYYISPKVWAWNQKRVLKIKKSVDKMFCILPFEVDFYEKWGMKIDYIGNPLLDAVKAFVPNADFRQSNKLPDKKIIALLPGSRKQELAYVLPTMLSVVNDFPQYQFIIAGAPNFNTADYQAYLSNHEITVLFNQTYDLLANAAAAIVTSGTATLETALFNVPQVVVYRGNSISIGVAKLLVKIRFISLVNLIADKEIVKELIQDDCNHNSLQSELAQVLSGDQRTQMLEEYRDLHAVMGEAGASQRAAQLMYGYLVG